MYQPEEDHYKEDQYNLKHLHNKIVLVDLDPGCPLHLLDRKKREKEEIENIDIENQV